MSQQFFQEQREQSIIKARIVSKYFSAWARVILGVQKKYRNRSQKMAYVDLFAGPGRYDDQSKSTPLLVLETILANPELSQRVVTMFNDKDEANIGSLRETIAQLENIRSLKHPPRFFNMEVGEEIATMFNKMKMIPTFFFVDPWGYKGLSLNLVSSIIKDWGCDCVFFFNYNRINMAVNNAGVEEHMSSIFGEQQLAVLREECQGLAPREREFTVVQALCDALRDGGNRYVLPFRFKNDKGTRTSHHLIFLSKNFKGYDIMKGIMYNESTENTEGVASFEYNPKDIYFKQGSLFDMLSRPLEDLKDMLLKEYAGRTIIFDELYREHSVDKPYIERNYKIVLRELYDSDIIEAINLKTGKAPSRGFANHIQIKFGG